MRSLERLSSGWLRLPAGTAGMRLMVCLAGIWLAAAGVGQAAGPRPEQIDFDRHIRPILSDRCFQCHGPDRAQRHADLRLDVAAHAERVVVPGQPDDSELLRRLTSQEPGERMPPEEAGEPLDDGQVGLVRRWIEQGAAWQEHWSFVPPTRPALPATQNPTWGNNPIDAFVLARLEHEGLQPSPEADRQTLIRRLALDLTGLPPTPDEVDQFLADTSPQAYQRLVDRLLMSPRYGERMAVAWLDAARYADTSGYQTDGERYMWRWRDWVIEAFNDNLPFDRFTIEQLAGDLLPEATLQQKIASGFNRNHRTNSEGGIVAEEYLVEYAADRVDSTFTVWLGLTMGCARCHDHKYDPITQQEFYASLAFFNNVPEWGRVAKLGNSPPLISAPTPAQQQQLDGLHDQVQAAEDRFRQLGSRAARAQAAWEAEGAGQADDHWTIDQDLLAHYPLDGHSREVGGRFSEGTFRGDQPDYRPGRFGQALRFDGPGDLEIHELGEFREQDELSLTAWVYPDQPHEASLWAVMGGDDLPDQGFSVQLAGDKLLVNYGPRWLDDAIRVQTASCLAPGQWHHVAVTYDGSQRAEGLKIYVDGQRQAAEVQLDLFTGTFTTSPPLYLGSRGSEGHFQGALHALRCYSRALTADEVAVLSCPDTIGQIAGRDPERRTGAQQQKLSRYFLQHHAPPAIRQAYQRLQQLRREQAELEKTIPTAMVMAELDPPRETFVLLRGEYDKPGERVRAGVPSSLPPLPDGAPPNRLGFARWLVDPSHPLTSRVAVNRYWQMLFGTGLVNTPEDFGSQGQRPSHPELLDWLATEFIRLGWDVKALQRLIVTSATYRQASRVTGPLYEQDPDNRLLARGTRLRLPAELIRDQALAAGGLLVGTLGGPSVRPYQPPGLWEEIASDRYVQDTGQKLYRRSMYTFWKRTVPPPTMTTFDAPSREMCVVQRTRTNTPLQALALLNDVTYVEAARALAERMMTEGGSTAQQRLAWGFRLATARLPEEQERQILLAGLGRHLARYRQDPEAARKLVAVGQSAPRRGLDPERLAAYTVMAGVILNLDEVITRE